MRTDCYHRLAPSSILLIMFCCLLSVGGKAQQIPFNHLTVENGLSQNSVLAITQDKTGFIWLGTRYGLNRYDGTRFKHYFNQPADSGSIPENYIFSLLSDSRGRLWVGTQAGLCTYQPALDQFQRIPQITSTIHTFLEDRNGRIWAGTNKGLLLFKDTQPNQFQQLFEKLLIRTILEDRKGAIWLGTASGLLRIEPGSEPFAYTSYPNIPGFDKDRMITTLDEAPDGKIWIGTQQQGVFLFDPVNENFEHLGFNEGFPSNNVRKIISDQKGRFWIGTLEGIYLVDPLSGKASLLQHDPGNLFSLSQNSIYSIYKDNAGSIWVGTYFGGVNIAYSDNQPFKNFQAGNQLGKLNNNVISSFQQDSSKNFWIGTEGGGLNFYDPVKGTFKAFKHQPDNPKSVGSNLVKTVYLDKSHRLWVGTHGGGINLYDPATASFRRFFNGLNNSERTTLEFLDFEEDDQGLLWVGKNNGLQILLFDGKDLNDVTGSFLSDTLNVSVKSIVKGSSNRIWIGSSDGLYLAVSTPNGTYQLISPKADQNITLLKENINCLYEDSKGQLWIGKNYQGLLRYNPVSGKLENISTREGLPNLNILGIQEDSNGFIWASTANGLVRINPQTLSINVYTTNDGLPTNEFNYNASFLDKDNNLLFGTVKGFTRFNPAQIKNNKEKSTIAFTGIKLYNQPVSIGDASGVLKQAPTFTKTILIGPDQSSFSIEFSLLNFIKPEKNKYAYKLEGLDKSWGESQLPVANFTNLPPGNYTLWVKGANNDGNWSDPASLSIIVQPPFWKSWWAYALYILGAAVLLLFITRYFFMQALLKKENDLHQIKLNFFTNVSHEIQTHLTLIMGPVENLLRNEKKNPVLQEKLGTVKANADRLLLLVRELLDFRKAESSNLQLKVQHQAIYPLLVEVLQSMQEYMYARKISCQVSPADSAIAAWIDPEQLKKVFFNLLINAVKFTPEKGKIEILLKEEETAIQIEIRDNGIGIAPEYLSKLFTNFFQVNDHGIENTGYGIGLALSKSIVELHNGNISVISRQATEQEAGYTSFTIRLPKGNRHFATEQIKSPVQSTTSFSASTDPTEISIKPVETNQLPSLLVIDDNEDIRKLIMDSLGHQYHIHQEKNGIAGLELAKTMIPDIIISDVMMPLMDGFTFCRHLKTDPKTSHIPVVLLTAKTTPSEQVEGLESGADVYLTKPFSTRFLELQIQNIIQSRQKLRSWFQQQLGTASKETIIQTISHNKTDEAFLSKMVALIEEHMENPQFGVVMLAEKAAMSQTVLYRKIKSMTGESVNDFIKAVKLKKAATLLLQNNMAIYEVAYAVGFSDRKYFSKEFKKLFGLNPTEYVEK